MNPILLFAGVEMVKLSPVWSANKENQDLVAVRIHTMAYSHSLVISVV